VGSGAVEMRRREKPPLRSPRSNGSRGVVIAAEELTRRFATGIVLAVGLGVAALLVPPVEATARKTVWHVQLDGDERLETVRIKRRRCE
jgi:hypothetical protein